MRQQRVTQTRSAELASQHGTSTTGMAALARTPAHPILRLQRTIGNRAVQRMIRAQCSVCEPSTIVARQPDDLEQELPEGYPDWQHGAPTKPVAPDPHVSEEPSEPTPPDQGPYRTPGVREGEGLAEEAEGAEAAAEGAEVAEASAGAAEAAALGGEAGAAAGGGAAAGLGAGAILPVALAGAAGVGAGIGLDKLSNYVGQQITGDTKGDYSISGYIGKGLTAADQSVSSLWADPSKPAYTQTLGWKLANLFD